MKINLKNIKKRIKLILSAINQTAKLWLGYIRANHLGLLNLAISLLIVYKLELIETSLKMAHEKLLKIYIDVLQAIGFDVMLLMQLIGKLFGGEEA